MKVWIKQKKENIFFRILFAFLPVMYFHYRKKLLYGVNVYYIPSKGKLCCFSKRYIKKHIKCAVLCDDFVYSKIKGAIKRFYTDSAILKEYTFYAYLFFIKRKEITNMPICIITDCLDKDCQNYIFQCSQIYYMGKQCCKTEDDLLENYGVFCHYLSMPKKNVLYINLCEKQILHDGLFKNYIILDLFHIYENGYNDVVFSAENFIGNCDLLAYCQKKDYKIVNIRKRN